ncbi:MAG: DNA repair protein RecO [Gemmatimonadaceae bacterium]
MVLVTDAIVLHAFDYLESSRILKLVTRDGGVRSVLARGMRKSKRRFGAAIDLYAEGSAELHSKTGRDLDTLAAFDVNRARPEIAGELSRFTGAATIAELTLRFAGDAAEAGLYEAVATALDRIGSASGSRAPDMTLGGAWRVLGELGVAPTIDNCAECHDAVDASERAVFSHPAGGVVCARCAHLARGGRTLPSSARDALRGWLSGDEHALADPQEIRAHQRLLREFLREHLADDRPMRAFDVWAAGVWSSPAPAARNDA